MLFLLLFKLKLNFTEKTNAFPAFPAFSGIPMVKAEYLKGIVAPTSAKAGKAGKAWVFSVKFNFGFKKSRKSMGFLSEIAYRNLQLAKKHGFLSVSGSS